MKMPRSNCFKNQGNGAILYLPNRKDCAGTTRTLFQSAHIASVNEIYSGLKDHKKRSGTTETNIVVDVIGIVVVPIRRTDVVIVVVPRAAPQHALWRPQLCHCEE